MVKYYPFGETRSASGTLDTDKLFTGQRLDDTGLYYYNARYYDATIGRFISADTIVPNYKNPQTLNRYSYCNNNPLKYVDPSGHLNAEDYPASDGWYPIENSHGDVIGYQRGPGAAPGSVPVMGSDGNFIPGAYVNLGSMANYVLYVQIFGSYYHNYYQTYPQQGSTWMGSTVAPVPREGFLGICIIDQDAYSKAMQAAQDAYQDFLMRYNSLQCIECRDYAEFLLNTGSGYNPHNLQLPCNSWYLHTEYHYPCTDCPEYCFSNTNYEDINRALELKEFSNLAIDGIYESPWFGNNYQNMYYFNLNEIFNEVSYAY